jgi:hypothetical protein
VWWTAEGSGGGDGSEGTTTAWMEVRNFFADWETGEANKTKV